MKEQKNNWLIFSSAGFQLAGALLLFGWIGHLVDNYFLSFPIGLVFGLVFGAFASLYHIWIMVIKK